MSSNPAKAPPDKGTAPPDKTKVPSSKAKAPAATAKAPSAKKRSARKQEAKNTSFVPKRKREPVGFGATELPDLDKAERLHCSGRQVPSPMGGFLESLGTRGEPNGTSTVLFECKISTLRFQLPLRRSTWRERRKVRAQADEGLEPMCPRAELGPALVRRGQDWYCPRCNLMFGRAP